MRWRGFAIAGKYSSQGLSAAPAVDGTPKTNAMPSVPLRVRWLAANEFGTSN
jgi:hypothetical protein